MAGLLGRMYQDQDSGTHNVNAETLEVFFKKWGMCFLTPLLHISTQSRGGGSALGFRVPCLISTAFFKVTRTQGDCGTRWVCLVITYVQTHQIAHKVLFFPRR